MLNELFGHRAALRRLMNNPLIADLKGPLGLLAPVFSGHDLFLSGLDRVSLCTRPPLRLTRRTGRAEVGLPSRRAPARVHQLGVRLRRRRGLPALPSSRRADGPDQCRQLLRRQQARQAAATRPRRLPARAGKSRRGKQFDFDPVAMKLTCDTGETFTVVEGWVSNDKKGWLVKAPAGVDIQPLVDRSLLPRAVIKWRCTHVDNQGARAARRRPVRTPTGRRSSAAGPPARPPRSAG